jgi:hypothetical protein
MNNATKKAQLTEAQFEAAQDKIDSIVRASKRGTPERDAADALSARWEAILAFPQSTATQRDTRRDAIAAFVAVELA